jgi:hypothetical protein
MKWVLTAQVEPPEDKTVSGRYGGSVCFVAYSKLSGWRMLLGGGLTQKIEEPPEFFCEDEWAAAHVRKDFVERVKLPSCAKRKDTQLYLW